MSASLLLVVLVSQADAADPTTLALTHAAQQILEPMVHVELRTYDTPLSDDALAVSGASSEVRAEIMWRDEQHRHVAIHCYLPAEHRTIVRELAFSDADLAAERGRTLGYALAALLPDEPRERPPPVAIESAPPPSAQSFSRRPVPSAPLDSSLPARYRGAVDAVALGATGEGGGLGAALAGRWFFHPRLGLRLAFATRRAELSGVHGFADLKTAALGLSFRYAGSDEQPFELGGRTDFLFMARKIGRFAAEGGRPQRTTSYLGGADLLLEAAWNASNSAALLLNAGLEVSFSDDGILDGQSLEELPPFRGVLELGARARF